MHEIRRPRHLPIRTDSVPARRRRGLGIPATLARRLRGRCADDARRSGDSRRRVGAGFGCARKEGGEGRLHSAHRLRVRGHRVGHGIRQEIRDQDRAEQGGIVGRRARQARQRRARRRARAVWPDLRRPDGHRRAEEGHGHPDEPQSQRAGDHAVEPVEGQGRGRRPEAQGADRHARSASTRSRRRSRRARTRCGSTTGSRRTASIRSTTSRRSSCRRRRWSRTCASATWMASASASRGTTARSTTRSASPWRRRRASGRIIRRRRWARPRSSCRRIRTRRAR